MDTDSLVWQPFSPPRIWHGANRWGYDHDLELFHADVGGYHWRRVTVSRGDEVLWWMADKTHGDARLLERRMIAKLAELLTDAGLAKALEHRAPLDR